MKLYWDNALTDKFILNMHINMCMIYRIKNRYEQNILSKEDSIKYFSERFSNYEILVEVIKIYFRNNLIEGNLLINFFSGLFNKATLMIDPVQIEFVAINENSVSYELIDFISFNREILQNRILRLINRNSEQKISKSQALQEIYSNHPDIYSYDTVIFFIFELFKLQDKRRIYEFVNEIFDKPSNNEEKLIKTNLVKQLLSGNKDLTIDKYFFIENYFTEELNNLHTSSSKFIDLPYETIHSFFSNNGIEISNLNLNEVAFLIEKEKSNIFIYRLKQQPEYIKPKKIKKEYLVDNEEQVMNSFRSGTQDRFGY